MQSQDLGLWKDPIWKSIRGEKATDKDFIIYHLNEAMIHFKNNQEALNKLSELKTILGVNDER